MLDLLTAFTHLLTSLVDFLAYAATTGSRLGQMLAVALVATGVGLTVWTLFYRRPRRRKPRPPRRPPPSPPG